jgi:SecD/SecF fusion protein
MKNIVRISFAAIFFLFISAGCIRKESYVLKMTITPESAIDASQPQALADASSVIRKRLNAFGIKDENIDLNVSQDKILMSINGIDTGNVEAVEGIVTTIGKLEFWETYENSEMIGPLAAANNKLIELNPGDEFRPYKPPVSDSSVVIDQMLKETVDSSAIKEREKFNTENPLFAILYPRVNNTGEPMPSCLIGLSVKEDTAKVIKFLHNDIIRNIFPRNLKLMWSRTPYEYDKSGTLFELHAIKISTISGQPVLDGKCITSSKAVAKKSSPDVRLNLQMNAEGSRIWSRMTRDNIDRCIAISLDGRVITYPRVMNEITGGDTEITGDFSLAEARYLAAIFSSGSEKMPVALKISDLNLEKIK